MVRWIYAGLFGSVALAGATIAQACTTLPNTLTNGTTADATQVMADLNGIVSCPLFTGAVGAGNTSPQTALAVGSLLPGTSEPTYHGDIQIAGGSDLTAGTNGLEFKTSTYGAGFGWIVTAPDRSSGNVPLSFASRNNSATWTERLTLRSDTGYVGIATASPAYPLDISGWRIRRHDTYSPMCSAAKMGACPGWPASSFLVSRTM